MLVIHKVFKCFDLQAEYWRKINLWVHSSDGKWPLAFVNGLQQTEHRQHGKNFNWNAWFFIYIFNLI